MISLALLALFLFEGLLPPLALSYQETLDQGKGFAPGKEPLGLAGSCCPVLNAAKHDAELLHPQGQLKAAWQKLLIPLPAAKTVSEGTDVRTGFPLHAASSLSRVMAASPSVKPSPPECPASPLPWGIRLRLRM